MKTIGIIGGIGPESTILYYRQIIQKYKKLDKDGHSPHIILNSINLGQMLGYVRNEQYDKLTELFISEIYKLQKAGAEFALFAANLAHIVFDRVVSRVNIPLISIVDETCKLLKENNTTKAALLGIKFTMSAGFYQQKAGQYGLEIILPTPSQQIYIHDIYVNQLIPGIIKEETKKSLIEIINDLVTKNNIRGIILGGTELSLILKQEDLPHCKLFDTTGIHSDAAVAYSLS